MTDKNMEKLINRALENETPDILDNLLKETGLDGSESSGLRASGAVSFRAASSGAKDEKRSGKTTPVITALPVSGNTPAAAGGSETGKKRRPWRHLYTALVSAAAVALIFTMVLTLGRPAAGGMAPAGAAAVPGAGVLSEIPGTSAVSSDAAKAIDAKSTAENTSAAGEPQETAGALTAAAPVFASVCIDVNPSVEISVDTDDRVAGCRAVNEDGKKILSKLDLAGTDITTASYALIGVMLTDGYLNELNNSILLSVISNDAAHGSKLEKDLASKLNTYLDESIVRTAIVGQYAKEDNALRKFAEANGISEGKARIIKELSASVPRLTEESLLKLSTHELLLVWNDYLTAQKTAGTVPADKQNVQSYGTVNTSGYISREDAANAAIAGIGADPASVSGLKTEFDCENGRIIYEVEFNIGGTEYESAVDAVSGELLYWNSEAEEPDDTDYDDEPDDADDDQDDGPDDVDETDDDYDDADDADDDVYEQEYDDDDIYEQEYDDDDIYEQEYNDGDAYEQDYDEGDAYEQDYDDEDEDD